MLNRLLDLSFVIGLFFLLIGALLLAYGFWPTDMPQDTQLVNRWCGGLFLLFGVVMNLLSVLGHKNKSSE